MGLMATEEKHGDKKGEEEDSDDGEFEEQTLLIMFDEFVIKSGNDRRDAVDFEEVVLIVENGIDKVLVVAQISQAQGPAGAIVPVDGNHLAECGGRYECGGHDIMIVVSFGKYLVVRLPVVGTEHYSD